MENSKEEITDEKKFYIFTSAIIVSLLMSVMLNPIRVQAVDIWHNLGPAGFSAGEAYPTSLAFYNDIPYMAFQDVANGSKVRVMSFGTPPIFSDVGNTCWANEFIERLYNAGITGGCDMNPLKYCPEGVVNRAQMAVFLVKTFNLP